MNNQEPKEVFIIGKCIIHLISDEVCATIVDKKKGLDIDRLVFHMSQHGIVANGLRGASEVEIKKLDHAGWNFLMSHRSSPGNHACSECALYVKKNQRDQAMAKYGQIWLSSLKRRENQ